MERSFIALRDLHLLVNPAARAIELGVVDTGRFAAPAVPVPSLADLPVPSGTYPVCPDGGIVLFSATVVPYDTGEPGATVISPESSDLPVVAVVDSPLTDDSASVSDETAFSTPSTLPAVPTCAAGCGSPLSGREQHAFRERCTLCGMSSVAPLPVEPDFLSQLPPVCDPQWLRFVNLTQPEPHGFVSVCFGQTLIFNIDPEWALRIRHMCAVVGLLSEPEAAWATLLWASQFSTDLSSGKPLFRSELPTLLKLSVPAVADATFSEVRGGELG